jgi:DNA-binding beta-propeller fold protein YncE
MYFIVLGKETFSRVRSDAPNTTLNTVTARLPFSDGPTYLAVSPDGSEVYALCNYQETNGTVAIIDTASDQVLPTTINFGGFPQADEKGSPPHLGLSMGLYSPALLP